MAADNGFRCILVLTSDIDLLYDQTLDRLKNALRGLKVMGKNDWKDAERFERQLRMGSAFVIVCSKNPSKLHSLLEAFKSARARGLPAFIIDDEADQASLNTHTSKGGEDISRINEEITQLRDFFGVNTYLQVTATPQALFLQRPGHRYRPSFTVLSEPGPGYVGGDRFFGDESRLLHYVDIDEVDELHATHQPSPTAKVPKGMRQALNTFLVAATAKNMADPKEGSAFLCHISMKKIDHKLIVDLIDDYKDDTMNILADPESSAHPRLIQELRAAYDDLSETQVDMPPFEKIIDDIKFYLPSADVKLVNSETKEEIQPDGVYNIFVGGNKLGRGVTIKNLLVSYYGRNPKRPNADTVLQHARMYGYRHNTIGLTRLFLPEKLSEHFHSIHRMESALRDLVSKFPEGRFQGIYISTPLQATRRNVLDPESLGMYVAGQSYNPMWPLRTEATRGNLQWLDEKLAGFSFGPGTEIDIETLVSLLEKCPPDPEQGAELWNIETIKAALHEIGVLNSNKAYLVVKRGLQLTKPRGETKQIISDDEGDLAPRDAPTLFMWRQEALTDGQIEVWWPQLRFPEGNYALAFSFDR